MASRKSVMEWLSNKDLRDKPAISAVTAGLNWYKTANYRSSKLTDSELETLTA